MTRVSASLKLNPDGIWAANETGIASFPADGHALCSELEIDSFWHRHRNRCIIEILKSHPPEGALFDIGGGNGIVSKMAKDAHIETVLLEPGAEGIRNARARGLPHLIQASFEAAHFFPGALPAVGLFDVIEHVDDDLAFLHLIYKALRPGGRLYATVPAYQALWSEEDRFAGHFRRYTLHELEKKIRDSGLEVRYSTYLFAPLVLPIFFLRALPSYLGLWEKTDQAMNALARKHHGAARGWSGRLLDVALRFELERIRAHQMVPAGSSCLVVAEKPSAPPATRPGN